MVEGVEGLAGDEDVAAEGFHLAAGGGVGHDNGARHLDHKVVARGGSLGRDVSHGIREGRHHDQAAVGHGRPAVNGFGWSLPVETAGETPDDGIRGPKQDPQAFLLHRGMEAADDRDSLIPVSLGEIVGVEDEFAGAFNGTE